VLEAFIDTRNLQVNSSTTFYAPPVSWPYVESTSSISSSNMGKFGNNTGLCSSAASGLVHPSGNSSYSASAQFPGQSFNHPASASLLATTSRQTYASNYSNGFNDEFLDAYTMPGAQYLLPGQDFAAQDMSRPFWRPMNATHSSHLNPSLEHDTTVRYGPSGFPYYNSSASSVSMADGSVSFPGLGSLATSLPLHASNASRTLPNPTSKRGSIQNITNVSQGALPDSTLSFGAPQNINGKSSVSWSNENVTVGSAQGAMTSIAIAANRVTEGSNGKPSSPTRALRDNSAFGYFSMAHTPMNMSSPQSGEYLPSSLSESSNSDSQLGPTDTVYHSRVSGDNINSNHSPSSNLYSYSVAGAGRYSSTTDSMVSEGTLTNGQPYTRLRQPEPQHVPSLDPLGGDSLESKSRLSQRTSIASASTRHY
jgi:hypothetical protein